MWSYFGSKSKTAKRYPVPKYKTIVEPFAGSAQYSLFGDNWKRNIILCDKYKPIVTIWDYLINKATKEMILGLPDLKDQDNVNNYSLSEAEKYLIGFCINRGSAHPKLTASRFNSWNKDKIWIANNLHKVKQWKIVDGSYEDLPNIEATWYIDPPYQSAGKWYDSQCSNKSIDYQKLAEYCKTRKGQVIVCENIEADWLPFKPLLDFHGQLHNRTEAIWLNGCNDTLASFTE
jgi:site-specific DNA-adenine methylase